MKKIKKVIESYISLKTKVKFNCYFDNIFVYQVCVKEIYYSISIISKDSTRLNKERIKDLLKTPNIFFFELEIWKLNNDGVTKNTLIDKVYRKDESN